MFGGSITTKAIFASSNAVALSMGDAHAATLFPVGQDVVTIGGIHGTIKSINAEEGTVTLEVATGVKIVFAKEAINPTATAAKK